MQDAQTFAEVLRTPYFPRPFDAPLAVVPSFNWHLLPGGVSNVFWHAATPSNSLVVAWENAPVNYDVSCLTNFQAEFFAGGHFSYRYDDRVVDYAPVFPFDWDNDGLENSVDPDPLVAGPDAHGTNAEWYNVLCSNVLEVAATSAALPPELSWREGVNSNAYYFVDVVAEDVEPGLVDVRRRAACEREHERGAAAAAGQGEATPLERTYLGVRRRELEDLLRRRVFRMIRPIAHQERHVRRKRGGRGAHGGKKGRDGANCPHARIISHPACATPSGCSILLCNAVVPVMYGCRGMLMPLAG